MPLTRINFYCAAESDTLALAEQLGRLAWPGMVLSLEGQLGAGKTVFARGFARGLGIAEAITSPSYPIIQEYSGRFEFCHMDWYRLGSEDEVLDTGAGEYLDSDHVCLVEWPARAWELFDQSALALRIEALGDGGRRISLQGPSSLISGKLGWPAGLAESIRPLLEAAPT